MPAGPADGLDWSMTSRSSSIVDWNAAEAVGRRIGGRGPGTSREERARLRTDLASAVAEATSAVTTASGLVASGAPSRAWVISRRTWVARNLQGLERALDPVADRLTKGERWSDGRRVAIGLQVGGLLGYASRKVLGQYDLFVPPDDDGLLYFVGPNVIEAERRSSSLPPRDFRLWIAAHEVTHRVQFGATPWLRGHLLDLVDRYLTTMDLDPGAMTAQVRRAVEEVRAGRVPEGFGAVFLLLSEEQRELFRRMQGLMSLLEGHATYVMNEVARDRVADLEAMRRTLRERRAAIGAAERAFQRASGFDLKARQYDAGERFVRAVVGRVGLDGFNAVWSRPEHLPLPEEIAEPARWIARVAGA
ncbi:MAG: zinc-dependent metalloprotease [Actinomycetota bacterium]